MNVHVFQTAAAQDLLRAAANLDDDNGDTRVKQIIHRLLGDLFRAIDELDITPDEIWAGIDYLDKLGQDGEAPLLAAGLGLEKYLDLRMDAEDRRAGIEGGTPRTIEGPLYVAGTPVRDGMAKLDLDADEDAGPLVIHGTIKGPDGRPVAGAVIECWHANSKGRYSHFDPTGGQTAFNLRGAVRTGADGKYEFRTLMPVGYGCPPHGATQRLLNRLGRHGNRPAHVHLFVTSERHRKLTTQFNIEGDPLLWDDFAYATRASLIPNVVEKAGGAALGLKADVYRSIEFNIALTARVAGRNNQIVNRRRASA